MRLIIFSILVACFFSCENTPKESIPNVDDIKIDDFRFVRFDQEIQDLDLSDIGKSYAQLKSDHPGLTDLYFTKLLRLPSENQDTFLNWIKEFVQEKRIVELQEKIDAVFSDGSSVEKDLRRASKFLRHYFPDKSIPNFYTYLTEYGYQCIIFPDTDKDGIGIGLDMFLGDAVDYKNIDPTNPAFSDYIIRTYNKDHISKKVMEIILSDIMGENRGKRFLDQMIYNGKKLYILNKLIPEKSDTVVMEYTADQWKWVQDNELEVWNFFTDQNLLYETNHMKINEYLNYSPHSPGMPQAAPGRTANYLGWRIVEAFMRRNPDYSLQDLIKHKDSQEFLELSKYKPKRR